MYRTLLHGKLLVAQTQTTYHQTHDKELRANVPCISLFDRRVMHCKNCYLGPSARGTQSDRHPLSSAPLRRTRESLGQRRAETEAQNQHQLNNSASRCLPLFTSLSLSFFLPRSPFCRCLSFALSLHSFSPSPSLNVSISLLFLSSFSHCTPHVRATQDRDDMLQLNPCVRQKCLLHSAAPLQLQSK